MTRLVKSSQWTEHSRLLGPTPSPVPAAAQPTDALSEAVRQLHAPAVAIDAVAEVTAQAASVAVDDTAERLASLEKAARDHGHEQGVREGRELALKAMQQEWSERLERVDRILEALEQAQSRNAAASEDLAIAVALESVAKILGRQSSSLELVRQMVQEVYQTEHPTEAITIRVSSDDYEALVAEPFIITLEEDQRRIRLVEDPRVTFGGCIVETGRGSMDARIEVQLDRLHKLLQETRRAEEG